MYDFDFVMRELKRIVKKVDEFRGPGLVNTQTAMSLAAPPVPPRVAQSALPAPGLDYQVLMSVGGKWIADWPRMH